MDTNKANALKHQAISALYVARQAKDETNDTNMVNEYVAEAKRLWQAAKLMNRRERQHV